MTGPLRVLVTIDIASSLIEDIRRVSPRVLVEQRVCQSNDEVAEAITAGVEVLYSRHVPPFPGPDSELKWIQAQSSGTDRFLGNPLVGSHVMVTNTSGAHAVPGAEFILGLMIALARGFPQLGIDQSAHEWRPEHSPEIELWGKTVGIVGYGAIGRQVGRLADAMGMRVLAAKGNPEERVQTGFNMPGVGDPEGRIPEKVYGPTQLGEMIADVDFVVLTLPRNPGTENLVDEAVLGRMKPTAYLVAVARTNVVDLDALVAALRKHRIAGAALDCLEPPPAPDSPIWDTPNLFITPYISASRANPSYDARCNEIFIGNLKRYLAGESLLNLAR